MPVVAFRVEAVDVPLEVSECQPVELVASQPDASLKWLLAAVAAAVPDSPAAATASTATDTPPHADRQPGLDLRLGLALCQTLPCARVER